MPLLALAVVAALVLPAPRAEVRVELVDGRVIDGEDLWREGDDYVLEISQGDTIVIPSALVKEVRLSGAPDPADEEPPEEDPNAWRHESGVIAAGPQQLAGQAPTTNAPTGLVADAAPRTLAGMPTPPPNTAEQTAALGKPARFQKSVVEDTWHPTTDWDMSKGQNDFAPSTWSESVVDSSWKPTSAFAEDSDQLAKHESTWSKPVVDSSWTPTSGFSK